MRTNKREGCYREGYYIPLEIQGHPTIGEIPLAIGRGVYDSHQTRIVPNVKLLFILFPEMKIRWKQVESFQNPDNHHNPKSKPT